MRSRLPMPLMLKLPFTRSQNVVNHDAKAKCLASAGTYSADGLVYLPSMRMWECPPLHGTVKKSRSRCLMSSLNIFKCGDPKEQLAIFASSHPSTSTRKRQALSHAILLRKGCSRRKGLRCLSAVKHTAKQGKAVLFPLKVLSSFLLNPFGSA